MKPKIGMIGLGKLGLPCILAMEKAGDFQVYGYDISNEAIERIRNRRVDFFEEGASELLQESNLQVVGSIGEMVRLCDFIFVAVQTPHEEEFEGKTPLGESRKDFDYSHIISVAEDLGQALESHLDSDPHIVFISTVLPGTMRREIMPLLKGEKRKGTMPKFSYNPYFIAMGTTIHDFLNPEFILVGSDKDSTADELANFYNSFLPGKSIEKMDVESAELTKVSYNTFIGFKIVFANAIAEITDRRGGNPDVITKALSRATDRLMSSSYMTPGMGDGGGCHPRDQIAMSWLAKETNMSFDIFEQIALGRDAQTREMARTAARISQSEGLPLMLLGTAYKPDTPLDVGSPVLLMSHFLNEMGVDHEMYDPFLDEDSKSPFDRDRVYFIGVRHLAFKSLEDLTPSSVIIDPWGYVQSSTEGVRIYKPGRESRKLGSR